MNYLRVYSELIEKRRVDVITDGYYEIHHIIPKSHGGSNSTDNLVRLTAREHFIAHWLLWRIHRDKAMAYAFSAMRMTNSDNRHYNSYGFEEARKAFSIAQTSKKHSEETKQKIGDAQKGINGNMFGKTHKEETKQKIGESVRIALASEEVKEKLRAATTGENNPMYGKTHSEETRLKISKATKGRIPWNKGIKN